MKYEIQNAIDGLDTIEDLLKNIPASITVLAKLPSSLDYEIRMMFYKIIEEHKNLLDSRYLEDISEKELRIIKKFGAGIDLLCQLDFNPDTNIHYDANYAVANTVINTFQDNTQKLIARIRKEMQQASPAKFIQDTEPQISGDEFLFSSITKEFIGERVSGGNWENKTQGSYETTFKLFIEIVGDKNLSSINSQVCRDFKTKIRNLPKNHSKLKKYRNKSVSTLVEMKHKPEVLISTESVNKAIGRLSSFFNWCVQQDYMSRNYMQGMQIRVNKKDIEKRNPFTISDLNKLFNDPIYLKGKMRHPYNFWLPLISLYSGARLQEICQLELADIYEVDGILVFDINTKSKTKRLKNIDSARVIPVHNKLIELGFKHYIGLLKRLKAKTLFPELDSKASSREGQSQPASRWFRRYKEKHGFPADGIKAFHSFRHNFADALKAQNAPTHISKFLLGHKQNDITYGQYGSASKPIDLNDALQKVEYPGFDTSRIKWMPR